MALNINGTTGISGVDGSNASPAIQGSDSNTGLSFGTDTVNINTGGTTRATVDSSGNLNIPNDSGKIQLGTSSDLQIYHDGSNSYIKDSGTGLLIIESNQLQIKNDAADEKMIVADANGAVELFHNGNKKFETANLQCIVTGLLQAYESQGGSIYGSNNNSHILQADNNGSAACVIEHSGGSSPYGLFLRFSDATPDNNTNYFISCSDGTDRLIIWSDGDIDNHDNSYGGTSDVKLKENIVDAKSQWDDIKAIRVRNFNFKTDTPSDKRIGVVAQEIETVCPSLVDEHPDKDENNKELGTTTKSVKYSILYMKAIKALQEAQARIETLEAEKTQMQTDLTALTARVAALEAG